METDVAIGSAFLMGVFGLGTTVSLFIIKQIADIRKELVKLCERMAREETKSHIYHGKEPI